MPEKRIKQIASEKGIKTLLADTIAYNVKVKNERGLVIRVTPAGNRYYGFAGRIAKDKPFATYTKAPFGEVGSMTWAEACTAARQWRETIKAGKDPRVAVDVNGEGPLTVAVAAALYLQAKAGADSFRDMRAYVDRLVVKLGRRLVADLTKRDVLDYVRTHATTYTQHNAFAAIKALIQWQIDEGYLPEQHVNPCKAIKPNKQFGAREERERALSDAELVTFWKETEKLPAPYRDLFRVLALTGARLNEIAKARWSALRNDGAALRIDKVDFKGDRTHFVALSSTARAIIAGIQRDPELEDGYIFSSDLGRHALSKIPERKGEIDLGADAEPWVLHDLRRTIMAGLRRLKEDHTIRHLVLGHSLKGLDAHYEGSPAEAEQEKLRAVEKWAKRVGELVNPPPAQNETDKVIELLRA